VAGGDVIAGRYRLDAEIGSGGTGEVWRAIDRETGATVALKRVRLTHLTGPERDRVRERLRAEAGIAPGWSTRTSSPCTGRWSTTASRGW
jgi:serine/threonine protein kinase